MPRENIIPYEPVGKLIEAAGADRVSHDAKVALSEYLAKYGLEIGRLSLKFASHAKRATVTDKDIKLAEKSLE